MFKPRRNGERVENGMREASASSTLLHGYRQNCGGVNGGVYGGVCGGVNAVAAAVLRFIEEHLGERVPSIAAHIGKSRRTVERCLKEYLTDKVEFRGAPKTGGYYLAKFVN